MVGIGIAVFVTRSMALGAARNAFDNIFSARDLSRVAALVGGRAGYRMARHVQDKDKQENG